MPRLRQTLTLASFLFTTALLSLFADPVAHAQSAGPPPAAPLEPSVSSSAGGASNNNLVSVFGELGYAYADSGFGIGGRYQRVIVPNGVIKNSPVHDEFGLEGGLDYYHYNFGFLNNSFTYNEIAIVFGGVWNFWLLEDKLALYPKLDIAYRIGSFSSNTGLMDPGGYGGVWLQGAVGGVYRLDGVSLRAELGSGSLRLGVGFSFF